MRIVALAAAAAVLFFAPAPASAAPLSTELSSQVTIGPGGVRLGHDRFESRDRRVRRDERRCRELRRACEFGPRGEGSCARYRRLCR